MKKRIIKGVLGCVIFASMYTTKMKENGKNGGTAGNRGNRDVLHYLVK